MIGDTLMGKARVERVCNRCGVRFYAPRNYHCPDFNCTGIMSTIIIPITNKRPSGVLCRDSRSRNSLPGIIFVQDASLSDMERANGIWRLPSDAAGKCRSWTKEQWQEQYGKLPRKGSKEAILLELPNA